MEKFSFSSRPPAFHTEELWIGEEATEEKMKRDKIYLTEIEESMWRSRELCVCLSHYTKEHFMNKMNKFCLFFCLGLFFFLACTQSWLHNHVNQQRHQWCVLQTGLWWAWSSTCTPGWQVSKTATERVSERCRGSLQRHPAWLTGAGEKL